MVHQCLPWYIVHAVCISAHCHYRLQCSFGICIQILFLNTKTDCSDMTETCSEFHTGILWRANEWKKVVACAKGLCIDKGLSLGEHEPANILEWCQSITNSVNLVQAMTYETLHFRMSYWYRKTGLCDISTERIFDGAWCQECTMKQGSSWDMEAKSNKQDP